MFRLLALVMVFLFWCTVFVEHTKAASKAFETFDGQVYNGKYYPKIDPIEWTYNPGSHSTMQLQVWWKGHPIEMSFELIEKPGGVKKMKIHYYIVERKEHICRESLAPGHFTKNNFKAYEDHDSDRDMIILATSKSDLDKNLKEIPLKKYEPCIEEKEEDDGMAAVSAPANRASAAVEEKEEKKGNIAPTYKTSDGSVKKKDSESPFYDW